MKICKVHGNTVEHKEGVSRKTNKPYSFDACTVKNADDSFCNAEIIEQEAKAGQTSNPATPDWDEIARGKVRSLLAEAAITHSGLVTLTQGMVKDLEKWTDYCMSGVPTKVEVVEKPQQLKSEDATGDEYFGEDLPF